MKILLVDNNTKHIGDIKKLCTEHEVIVKRWELLQSEDYKDFDLVILSGGSGMAIDEHEKDLAKEIKLIKNSDRPIIGICLGFELICHSFGSRMEREDEREKGIFEIETTEESPIFAGKKKLKVFMAHKWHVKEVGANLIVLAKSPKGIDVIKHKDKPIYGFQFHPEITDENNDGAEIFYICLKEIAGNS